MSATLTLPGIDPVVWTLRTKGDAAANRLADAHYSRGRVGAGQVGPPGRLLVLVTPCERAAWISHWPAPALALDGLDAWRCSMFRNEGAGLSSDLIVAAMALTRERWGREELPSDGWVTWVDRRRVPGTNPGYCFERAGWIRDRAWSHRHLIRWRAPV